MINSAAYLRKKMAPLVNLFGKFLAKTKIHPNIFSLLVVPLSIAAVIALTTENYLYAAGMYFIAAVWDIIDGPVARFQNRTSDFGYYIEGVYDKWSEAILIFGFVLIGYHIEASLLLVVTVFMTVAKPRTAMVTEIGEFDWPALASRHERVGILILMLFAYHFKTDIVVGDYAVDILSYGLWFSIVYVFLGQLQRILFARKIILSGGVKNMKNIPKRKR